MPRRYATGENRAHGVNEENMSEANGLLTGRRGLVMGVANERSIAWGIARVAAANGAELAFSYQADNLRKRVAPLAASVGSDMVLPCDVTNDESVDRLFEAMAARWDRLDFLVHAIAYSDKDELTGGYIETSADNFARTMQVSC
jgi:enoyl-[acyl-carrier protein] reductase I